MSHAEEQLIAHPEDAPAPGPEHRDSYSLYEIPIRPSPDLAGLPSRFKVDINRLGLARLLLTEIVKYRGDWDVILSRPCIYGVFSGPVGGFMAREHMCVGCLRCTIQHPEVVTIRHNPAWSAWGDSYIDPKMTATLMLEAATGRVPVRGQGYRGRFGGSGWDGMWTDMSEIVRPTRDGIHGREFISTVVDIGAKPAHLSFDEAGELVGDTPWTISIQLPLLFDVPPASARSAAMLRVFAEAAHILGTFAILPARELIDAGLHGVWLVPQVEAGDVAALARLGSAPGMVELKAEADLAALTAALPDALPCLRLSLGESWHQRVVSAYEAGFRVFHVTADYHGQTGAGFIQQVLLDGHRALVAAGIRDQLTIIASGGIAMAEHVPKAIICGADAVALGLPPLLAMQCQPQGECLSVETTQLKLPPNFTEEWGIQRMLNLTGAWRDQLLEIMGAMGLREVRRLRGEIGRAMFQADLEREAFGDIDGF